MNVKELLTTIKAFYLFALTTLVLINTYVLVFTVLIVGNHVMPDNQAAAELWEVVILAMQGCLSVIIICGVAYGTVKIVKGMEKK